jgi:3-oxoadipate enol-lactonase
MATFNVNGTAIYYEDTGRNAPPVVFSHGLLWNSGLFAPQIAALKDRFRCIAYDHRGQGKSADGTGRAIGIDTLTNDAETLIEGLCSRLRPFLRAQFGRYRWHAARHCSARPY